MSNIVYTKGQQLIYQQSLDWASDPLFVLLERSTSTYAPDVDHEFLDDFTTGSGIEITVASYARQLLASLSIVKDDTNDRIEADAGNVAFGTLESGQTVKAAIIAKRVGADYTTPEDDPLIMYLDGKIRVVMAAPAASSATTIYVLPLEADLADGAVLDFGGGATATLNGAHSEGAQTLSISALAASASVGDVSETITANSLFPFSLGGGNVNLNVDDEGLLQIIKYS